MTLRNVLVTGAGGTTATPLVERLLAAGHSVTAASRTPPRIAGAVPAIFDWYDERSHAAVLEGQDAIYLVPPPFDPDPGRVMVPFIQRATSMGVRRVVLLSAAAVPAGGHAVGAVHAALPEVAAEWCVLRPSWFLQNFIGDHPHAASIRESGTVTTATGKGRVGFIDVRDIAAVADTVLTADTLMEHELVLTGPETLNYDDIACQMSEHEGVDVTHVSIAPDELVELLSVTIPRPAAELLVQVDQVIAHGGQDFVTDVVRQVTGRRARSWREVLSGRDKQTSRY